MGLWVASAGFLNLITQIKPFPRWLVNNSPVWNDTVIWHNRSIQNGDGVADYNPNSHLDIKPDDSLSFDQCVISDMGSRPDDDTLLDSHSVTIEVSLIGIE